MTYSSISQGGLSLMSKSAFSSVPPPRAYPFVGNAPSNDIDTPVQTMMRLARDLGPVYRLQFPSQPALVVGEYRLVEELSDPTRFEKIGHAPLLVGQGRRHRSARHEVGAARPAGRSRRRRQHDAPHARHDRALRLLVSLQQLLPARDAPDRRFEGARAR